MIVRYPIKCTSCGATHTLRIGVGHTKWQEHNLKCAKCDEDIRIAMDLDQEKGQINEIRCIENCEPTDEEGLVINLHPEFVVPAGNIHSDLYSAALEQMHYMKTKEATLPGDKTPKGFYEEWVIMRKAWAFNTNGRKDLLEQKIQERFGERKDIDIFEWMFRFFRSYIAEKGWKKFEAAMEIISETRKRYPLEFTNFLIYYKNNLKTEHMAENYEIFNEYFKEFTEYNQLYLYYMNNLEIDERFRASSDNYRKTKMFYGNAYEVFTSHVIILALINNILNGRKFDEFATMDLKTYKTINKANRCNPFKDVDEFTAICDPLDSTLRNASHH